MALVGDVSMTSMLLWKPRPSSSAAAASTGCVRKEGRSMEVERTSLTVWLRVFLLRASLRGAANEGGLGRVISRYKHTHSVSSVIHNLSAVVVTGKGLCKVFIVIYITYFLVHHLFYNYALHYFFIRQQSLLLQ